MPPCHSGSSKCVPAVSRFSEGVRAEAEPSFRRHDVIDDRFIGPFVKVVHKLGALVAKKSGVFKPDRTFHTFHATQ